MSARRSDWITQAGSACTFAISPSEASVAGGGLGSVSVSTSTGCGWSASSRASSVAISTGWRRHGRYSVAKNITRKSRGGTLAIGGQAFTMNQTER
jgi:hypothetical protein